jgi:uncharacterized protein (DUF362 family)
MAGDLRARTGFRSAWHARWTHPTVVRAAVQLISKAGAKKIRIVESAEYDDHPLEENILIGGWSPGDMLYAAPDVEMENTGCLGFGKEYRRLQVPGGGLIYPAFDVNHSYAECDALVSIAKLKEHETAGLALTMENMIGIAPGTIYGDAAGNDKPAPRPWGARNMFATGWRQPPESAPKERDPASPREPGYRLPRVMVDLARARPVDLAIIDGIETQTAAAGAALEEDSKRRIVPVKPSVLLAGLNPVCTDAVAAAVMGFDPMAAKGFAPFEDCDSVLQLAEEAGIGSRDLNRIEVAGTPVNLVRLPFRDQR